MNDEPIVSVLVAAFNAEKYIRQCLDSLLSQSLRGVEVIVIDDHSTDSTPQIISSYAAENDCIHPIYLVENSGQAHARNVGLSEANGRYICFLDSDDWLAADALQRAVDVFRSNELIDSVLFDVVQVYEDGYEEHYKMPPFTSISGSEAFEPSLSWRIHGVYMVKADIHRRYPYDESCRLYSDDNTTRMHYLASRKVARCDGKYFYRQHAASTTHSISGRRFDLLRANAHMKQMIVEAGCDDRIISMYENERWLNVVGVYKFYYKYRRRLSPDERKTGLEEIRSAWRSIETRRLTLRNRLKFGYMPMLHPPLWPLFRLQEEAYFTLRRIFRRL